MGGEKYQPGKVINDNLGSTSENPWAPHEVTGRFEVWALAAVECLVSA